MANKFYKATCITLMTGLIAAGSATAMATLDTTTAVAKSIYKVKNSKLISIKTGKVVKGFKVFKSTLYKNGKKYTGVYKGYLYKSGKKFTGSYNGYQYKKGAKFTGRKDNITYKYGKVVSAKNVSKVAKTAIVYFEDKNLLHTLNDLMGRKNLSQNIKVADLRNLKGTLDLKGDTDEREYFGMMDYVNIQPLAFCTNISELSIANNAINSLFPISNLTNLKKLDISFNKISSIDSLEKLVNLTELKVAGNNLKDILVIGNFKNLKELNAWDNKIDYIDEEIKYATNLENIDLSNNRIRSISELASLKNLKELNLTNNKIKDIQTLSENKNLETLYLSYNSIFSVDGLEALPNLKTLYLNANYLTSMNPLAKIKTLTTLHIEYNDIPKESILPISTWGSMVDEDYVNDTNADY
ncbi:leucine-rich repeat domain-containing protein [Rummeliibacillus sp. TYF005]|uniref:leucine-rich repeat domain-containing protein n=1 Tax=Rummeliibacillus sp. TYF005 TaxID=2058214 RepID=UPI000F523416|nr:leucine-rich repeat domain-containing protein [Rummeliibacillus sp. TYF005]RPJ94549.1 leucine-rich repeat domain-containing protein [Rummeliibacillus sp. TYF005]